jgi:hypothetical protein
MDQKKKKTLALACTRASDPLRSDHTTHNGDHAMNNAPQNDPNFVPQNKVICWKGENGFDHFRSLYTPSAQAVAWDGAPVDVNAAIDNRHGAFSYVKVEITGRKQTRILNRRSYDQEGIRCRITFTSTGFDGVKFEDSAEAWIFDRK